MGASGNKIESASPTIHTPKSVNPLPPPRKHTHTHTDKPYSCQKQQLLLVFIRVSSFNGNEMSLEPYSKAPPFPTT
jgi:hypothetical protein